MNNVNLPQDEQLLQQYVFMNAGAASQNPFLAKSLHKPHVF